MERRTFLKSTAAASAVAAISPKAWAGAGNRIPRVGLIGAGWYGKVDSIALLNVADVEFVSVCDVDSKMLNEAADMLAARQNSKKRPAVYENYKKLLSGHEHDIVIVGTPDHWHSLPMIAAVESGADVYCQKPTGCDVLESKAMLDAARKHDRVVQIGTQRRSTPHLAEAKKRIVDEGLLGDVAHVEVCCYYHMRDSRSLEKAPDIPVPDHLNWDLWCGPAPKLPYNDIMHPRGWRAYMEYGNGIVGDMCVHMFDMTRWLLNLGWPQSISSAGGILVDTQARANITDTQTATFHYDDLNVVWTHRSWGHASNDRYPWAAIIYGDKGTLKLDVNRYEFEPRDGGKKISADAVIETDKFPDAEDKKKWNVGPNTAPGERAHMKNFLQSVQDRSKPVADIEQGHISSASCILANIAMEVGKTLEWDPETHRVTNSDAANEKLKRDWRKPYQHPAG